MKIKKKAQHVQTRFLISLKDGLGPASVKKRLDYALIMLSGTWRRRCSFGPDLHRGPQIYQARAQRSSAQLGVALRSPISLTRQRKTRPLNVGEGGCVGLRAVASAGPVTSLRTSASSLSEGGRRPSCRQPRRFRQAAWPEPTLTKRPFPSCPGDTRLVIRWERLAALGSLRLRAADPTQHASLQPRAASWCSDLPGSFNWRREHLHVGLVEPSHVQQGGVSQP